MVFSRANGDEALIADGLAVHVQQILRPIRPGRGLRCRLDPNILDVPPGGRVRFRLVVENPGPVAQDVALEVPHVEAGWSARLLVERLRVAPRSATTLYLRLEAPRDARPGERQNLLVLVRGERNTRRLEAEVRVASESDMYWI